MVRLDTVLTVLIIIAEYPADYRLIGRINIYYGSKNKFCHKFLNYIPIRVDPYVYMSVQTSFWMSVGTSVNL